MTNKDTIGGVPHSRPCFFAFPDIKLPEIYWIVPISSKFEKYKPIEQEKIQKYGRCNTIRFSTVLGRNTAFLLINMCPATETYLTPYIDKNNHPIRIDNRVAADVEKNARNVLAMAKRGAKVIFSDVFSIYHASSRFTSLKLLDFSCFSSYNGMIFPLLHLQQSTLSRRILR